MNRVGTGIYNLVDEQIDGGPSFFVHRLVDRRERRNGILRSGQVVKPYYGHVVGDLIPGLMKGTQGPTAMVSLAQKRAHGTSPCSVHS